MFSPERNYSWEESRLLEGLKENEHDYFGDSFANLNSLSLSSSAFNFTMISFSILAKFEPYS
jgi:hypothetical protein